MSKKHKKKRIYTISVTSDNSCDKTKYYRSRFNIFRVVITFSVLITVIAIVMTWFIYREMDRMEAEMVAMREVVSKQETTINELGIAKADLEAERTILQTSLGKQYAENIAEAEIKQERALPSGFPLTQSAEMEEQDTEAEGYVPIAVFLMDEASDVVCSGDGVVTSVREDSVFGNCVVVDHGNGYVTYYRNPGQPKVFEGDEVVRGAILFVGGLEEDKLGYQMTYHGNYVEPLEICDVFG